VETPLIVIPGPGAATRHYESADVLDAETMNARIRLGLHFRRAMVDANQLGHRVSDRTVARCFRPC
jgi:hypothetical protein